MIPSPVNLSTVPSKRSTAVGEDGEEALHDLAPLLRVLPLGQVHRAAHVGEQHRHLLALAVVLADLGHRQTDYAPGSATDFVFSSYAD